jgi:hypothetical protein
MAAVPRVTSLAPSALRQVKPSPIPIPHGAVRLGSISLDQVETWIPRTTKRMYAVMDNLNSHRTTDVLLFLPAHPRWEMVFPPKYAAYLILIEPCGRSCARSPKPVGATRPGRRSPRRSTAPRPTGLPTATPSSGANAAVTAHAVHPALPSCRGSHDLPDALKAWMHGCTATGEEPFGRNGRRVKYQFGCSFQKFLLPECYISATLHGQKQ